MNKNVSYKDVSVICKKVGIHEYIDTLPQKYDTDLQETGNLFSSGQKQKINVARALIRNSPIMIFDEVTSNLDGNSEKEIMRLLQEVAIDHLVIVISHRVSSIILCDKIFVINDGQIIDSGKHYELIERNDLYRRMIEISKSEEV